MRRYLKNSKILLGVIALILIGGSCLAIFLLNRMHAATAAQTIQTAASEYGGSKTNSSSAAGSFSTQTLQKLVQDRVFRRNSTIIPSLDTPIIYEADTWEKIVPADNDGLKTTAFEKSVKYVKDLFDVEMKADYTFSYYTDSAELRGDFMKVASSDGTIVCTLAADTLDLINIDYAIDPDTLPALESWMTTKASAPSAEILAIADKVAAVFKTAVSTARWSDSGGNGEFESRTYDVVMKNGMYIKFAILNGELYAVGVYPTEACMNEGVYFKADIQRDISVVHLVSPQDFRKGDPGTGDMTKDEARQIYLQFLNLANGAASYPDPAVMTFYIDHSGKRENYWHIEGDKLTMDISSKSKWLISLTCTGLYNPDNDLTKIEYPYSGGLEYKIYVRDIISSLYGTSVVKVGPNAVSDGHYCTYDAWMDDGTCYEFFFKDGRLMEVRYFFDDEYMGCIGWEADNTYVNTLSGETFIRYY